MASGIDATKPVAGNALTSNVRANFAAAETEINELQRATEDAVTAGGTVDALTANFTTDVVLAEGVTIVVKATGANTGATTLNVDGTGVKSVVRKGGGTLFATDIVSNLHYLELRYDNTNSRWVLQNHGVWNDSAKLEGQDSAFHLARTNHTGSQAQSTITSLTTDLGLKAPLASPALTGTPTAPTASVGDNDTSVATTEYVQQEFDGSQQSLVEDGFQKFPGGFIMQWGKTASVSDGTTITFPIAFTTTFSVVATPVDNSNLATHAVDTITATTFKVQFGGGNSVEVFNWIATGK